MEEILKQILSEIKKTNEKLDSLEKEIKTDIKELKEGQVKLEGKIDKLSEKEEEHFNQVLNEIGYVFNDLENKIKAVDTKV